MSNTWIVALSVAAALTTPAASSQDPHKSMNDRGAAVMGFDQETTVHHFYLYDDGGAIDIAVKDAADAKNRDAIRSHLKHIAMMFGTGNFDAPMLVHDAAHVPGTAVMTDRKAKIAYSSTETPKGGRVDIVTKDKAALSGIHDFMKYQIMEHHTGDPATVGKRK